MTLTIGSLFSGIGGLELGLEWAGLGPVKWQVEQSGFCRRVLAKHWPNVRRFRDVREVGSAELTPVDLICGGFPCQDLSSAGKGAGLAGRLSGLWWEFLRVALQTPRARDWKGRGRGPDLPTAIGHTGAMSLNPQFREWMMGFATGWTELRRQGTLWFRSAPK